MSVTKTDVLQQLGSTGTDAPGDSFAVSTPGGNVEGRFLELANDNTSPRPLVIAFHGAVTRGVRSPPVFEGGFLGARLRGIANVLGISDPNLRLSAEIRAGWFADSEGRRVMDDVAYVIERVITVLRPTRVVFFGTSCGAHGALTQSYRVPESVCVVRNPIVCISRYEPQTVSLFVSACWPTIGDSARLHEFMLDDVGDLYKNGFTNRIIMLQNATDPSFLRQGGSFIGKLPRSARHFLPVIEFFPGLIGHLYPVSEVTRWIVAAATSASDDLVQIAMNASGRPAGDKRVDSPTSVGEVEILDDVAIASIIASSVGRAV